MNNKKFRKLLRDPKLFFRDMYAKRVMKLKKYLPLKYEGNNQFTIVSAVYNVEKYLDEYFDSIVKQSLNFKKHIQIILVDDGSTDHSAEIIKRWQAKFPQNIHYFYKENGGQASARNLGLQHTQTEWVVFTDPDDYLHPDYFKSVDTQISQHPSAVTVATNMIFFFENQNIIKDNHPLKFRFDKTHVIDVAKLDKFINMSAASTFFRVSHIKKQNLVFDHNVKPNFEDGKFIADYLLDLQDAKAVFDRDAVYFYRKRESGTSTLDTSWQKVEKFSNVFEYGFLPMLQNYKNRLGHVPSSIQKTALYDMAWYIQQLLNRPERLDLLDTKQKSHFYDLMQQVFNYIDEKNIMEFGLAGVWLFHKVGILGMFKQSEPPFQIAYIENIDRERKQFLISYFTYFDQPYSVQADGHDLIPVYVKSVINKLNEQLFVYEKRLWVPYGDVADNAKINILLNKKAMRISIKGKTFMHGIALNELIGLFTPSEKYLSDGSWLLMDRETKADDNAEHFYRYMMQNHPEQTCYFALNRTASDWNRLEQEGFKLVEFGGREYEQRLRKAEKIISSHLEKHINNYFGDLYEHSKKFVFLQHGVTQNDLSAWFNTKTNLHCFITTATPEYQTIIANPSRYKLTKKETVLAGFPRYDSLVSKNIDQSRKILIMPTWRNNIVGQNIGRGSNTRALNSDFMKTSYAQHWFNFLHSINLRQLAEKFNYEVIFAPHPNIEPYLDFFDIPNYIQVWKGSSAIESIQTLFGQSSILITDYSSVAFDMAYLNKSIIYYQFDQKEFFSGAHTLQRGWFDYESSGFGPVTLTGQETFNELENILKTGLKPKYLERIRATFPFQKGGNCERVYQAIIALDHAETVDNLPILVDMIEQAENHQAWDLAASRIQTLLDTGRLNAEETADYRHRYLNALFESKQFDTLQNLLPDYPDTAGYWHAKMDLYIGNAVKGAEFFAENEHIGTQNDLLISLLASSFHQAKRPYEKLFARIGTDLPDSYQPLLTVAQKLSEQNYFVALALLKTYIDSLDDRTKGYLKPELLASYLCMKLGNLQGAHQYLVSFENHTQNDPSCRIAIARLAKLRGDSEKLFTQLNRAFEENLLLIPEDLTVDYLKKMYATGNTDGEGYLLAQLRQKYPENPSLALYEAEKLAQNQDWESVTKILADFAQTSPETMYLYTTALCRLKNHQAAQRYFDSLSLQDTAAYWKLAAEIAEAKGDKALQAECLKKQLACLE